MSRLNELAREYEARHYPPTRRLDLQGQGPETARQRALQWIQSFAHEQPGADLLLVVERTQRRHGGKTALRIAVEKLLDELKGGLIDWWQPFAEGSLALRVSRDPHRFAPEGPRREPEGEGRTPETAGAKYLSPRADIPEELLPLAERIAEMRRTRERMGVSMTEVVLRGLWIEAQARSMAERVSWEAALEHIRRDEEARLYDELDD